MAYSTYTLHVETYTNGGPFRVVGFESLEHASDDARRHARLGRSVRIQATDGREWIVEPGEPIRPRIFPTGLEFTG